MALMDFVVLAVDPVGQGTCPSNRISTSGIIKKPRSLFARNWRARLVPSLAQCFAALLLFCLPQPTHAVTLAWDAVTNTPIAGYYLYVGTSTGSYDTTNDVSNLTQATLTNLLAGSTYFFAVTAYDANRLQSDFSTEISYSVPTNTVTTNLPAIALTYPPDGAVFSGPALLRLTASVSANGHTVQRVQFYNSATRLGQDSTAPYAMNWSNAVPGTYNLRARLLYDTNLVMDSSVATLTFLPPSVPVSLATPKLTPGGFQTVITWNIGQSYRIQRSTNLLVWTDLLTRVALESNYTFLDPSAAVSARNFYRVVSP
jgi:hypothetical protein